MLILDGKVVSEARRAALKARIQKFQSSVGRPPHLVVVLVGENAASQVYIRNKVKACESVGMRSTRIDLPSALSQEALNATLLKLNGDDGIDGILVQLPLPSGLREEPVLELISSAKDADAFSYRSLGYLWGGYSRTAPCTPQGVMSILEYYKIPIAGRYAVVVGRSNIVGKPMAHLLTMANATVTVCHSKTLDLRRFTKEADIVVVAAGQPRFLGREDFKQGSIIIDVGMHGTGTSTGPGTAIIKDPGHVSPKVFGDVRFEELEGWALRRPRCRVGSDR